MKRNFPGFIMDPVRFSNNVVSALIGVRPDNGEPIILVVRSYRALLHKRKDVGWFARLKYRVLHLFKERWVQLNQLLIINLLTRSLETDLIKVANSLIDGALISQFVQSKCNFEKFETCIELCLSPGCTKAFYFKVADWGPSSCLILDFFQRDGYICISQLCGSN